MRGTYIVRMKTANYLRFLPSNPFQALTVKTAADYVSGQNDQGYSFEVTGTKMGKLFDDPAVTVETLATSLVTGETFPADWEVWVEPERGHPSGLYGEW